MNRQYGILHQLSIRSWASIIGALLIVLSLDCFELKQGNYKAVIAQACAVSTVILCLWRFGTSNHSRSLDGAFDSVRVTLALLAVAFAIGWFYIAFRTAELRNFTIGSVFIETACLLCPTEVIKFNIQFCVAALFCLFAFVGSIDSTLADLSTALASILIFSPYLFILAYRIGENRDRFSRS